MQTIYDWRLSGRAPSVVTIAAYRDRYGITSRDPLGGPPADDNQRLDHARAETALRRATEASARPMSQGGGRRGQGLGI